MKGVDSLLAAVDRLVHLTQYLQSEPPSVGIDFPFPFRVGVIHPIPRRTEDVSEDIQIFRVLFEFVDISHCRIISFRSAGNDFITEVGAVPILVSGFETRSATKARIPYQSFDYAVGAMRTFYREEDVYNPSDYAIGFTSLSPNIQLSDRSMFDDDACYLSVNANGDRFVLNAPSGGWENYLRSIVLDKEKRFGYTRDGTD